MASFVVVGMKFLGCTPEHIVSTYADNKIALEPEPTNSFDPNAIKILVEGKHMGYVAKNDCPKVKQYLAEHPNPIFNVADRYQASVNVTMDVPGASAVAAKS